MKSALSRYNGLLAVVLTACGLLHVAQTTEAVEPPPPIDKCNNGYGTSIPGYGSDRHCLTYDCCNWYQTDHIHYVGPRFAKTIDFSYTPGFTDGCRGTLTLSTYNGLITETNKKSVAFTDWGSINVVSRRLGGGWTTYHGTLDFPHLISFNHVKIKISPCYNDYSSVDSITR